MDQGFLGLMNRAFDSLQLLRNLKAGLPQFNHRDHGTQMPIGATQALQNLRVGFVLHGLIIYPLGEDMGKAELCRTDSGLPDLWN